MTDLAPLIMEPVLAEKPWGGRRLGEYGKALPAGTLIGESWEVADLPSHAVTTVADPRSRVASGPFAGKSLHELITEYGGDFLGCVSPTEEGDFPLLVKLLDAHQHLSVQVHPDRQYVRRHPVARLKAESWYVIGAAPDAHLYLGLRRGVTVGDVATRLGSDALIDLLEVVPARPGDFYHLPAGLVHALGGGVLVAEVQTPSDTTFRIHDWYERYDRPRREMHAAAALEAIRPELTTERLVRPAGPGIRVLRSGDWYWITEHRCDGGAVAVDPKPEVRVIMVLEGEATADGIEISRGTTVVIPAAIMPSVAIKSPEGSVLLEVGLV